MNILVVGSSTSLGSHCIEHFFLEQHRIITTMNLISGFEQRVKLLNECNSSSDSTLLLVILEGKQLRDIRGKSSLISEQQKLLQELSQFLDYFTRHIQRSFTCMITSSTYIYNSEFRDEQYVTEETAPLANWAADFYKELESTTFQSIPQNCRLVYLRLGEVISRQYTPHGCRVGFHNSREPFLLKNSTRSVNWVSVEDAARAILFLLSHKKINGPVNITSESAIQANKFYQLMNRNSDGENRFTSPDFLSRLITCKEVLDFIDYMCQAVPQKLKNAGFDFHHNSLQYYLTGKSDAAQVLEVT